MFAEIRWCQIGNDRFVLPQFLAGIDKSTNTVPKLLIQAVTNLLQERPQT